MKNLKFFKNIYSLKRVNLEKLSLIHLKDIHEYSKNKRFFKYFEYQQFKKESQTKKYIISKLKEVRKNNAFWWSIKLRKTNKIIGTISVHNINLSRRTCEVGYGINPDYWGNGFFTEILKGLSKIILKKNRFLRCQAITSKKNPSSVYGLIKCGFNKEGVMKKFYRSNKLNKNFDAVIHAKTLR